MSKPREWRIHDGSTNNFTLDGPDIAYAEIVHAIEATPATLAAEEMLALLKEYAQRWTNGTLQEHFLDWQTRMDAVIAKASDK